MIFDAFAHLTKTNTPQILSGLLNGIYYDLNWITAISSLFAVLLAVRGIDHIARRNIGDIKIGFFTGICAGFGFANQIFLSAFPVILSYVHSFLKMTHI